MATVIPGEDHLAPKHFGLYRTHAGGDEPIIVRRKIGEPRDVMHSKSRRVLIQRARFTEASQHYSSLNPIQKWLSRYQMKDVSYVKDHGTSGTKLLQGRQLFISEDIASLRDTGTLLVPPVQICIVLVDENYDVLEGTLHLYYIEDAIWHEVEGEELDPGNWLFKSVPMGKQYYRVEGEAPGYYDPKLPENQWLTEHDLKQKHWHVLLELPGIIIQSYPEPTHERGTIDGQLWKTGELTWWTIRAGNASGVNYALSSAIVGFAAHSTPDKWNYLYRSYNLFDTYLLPDDCDIVAARLIVRCLSKDFTDNFPGGFGISGTDTKNDNNLIVTDWWRFKNVLLSDVHYPDDLEVGEDIVFQFNQAGLDYLNKTGVTRLCIREAIYDIGMQVPPWDYPLHGYLGITQAEQENVNQRPRLEIFYE